MPVIIPPAVAGALKLGALIAGRQAATTAARKTATSAAKKAATTSGRSTAKRTAAKRTTKKTTKRPSPGRTGAKPTTPKKPSGNQYIDRKTGQPRTPGYRTAKQPGWVKEHGRAKPKIKITEKDRVQTARLQAMKKTKKKTSTKKKVAYGAGGAGVAGLLTYGGLKKTPVHGPEQRFRSRG